MKQLIRSCRLLSVALALAFGCLMALAAPAPTLDQILTKMDKVGQNLKSLQAEIVQKKWTDILGEYDEGEKGEFLFLKEGDGIYLRKEISEPTASVLVIKDGNVTFYQPAIKQAQEYKLGNHKDKAEFMLLGFGTNKEALRRTYDISYLGEDQIDGKTTYQLELKPKSDQVAAFFVRIILWVDAERGIPIQQQLVEPTQDHLLIRFSDIRLNPKLSKSDFDVKLPRDVRVIRN
jgi:outer membrane lipoprotein-sorting protein